MMFWWNPRPGQILESHLGREDGAGQRGDQQDEASDCILHMNNLLG